MTPLEIIRRKKIFRFVSAFLALNMITCYITPTSAFALTSGPGQEEFASFEPVSTSDMVDLYTGDFNYNIPLMSVPGPNGGYPINIAYHSGIGMDQEASWVGLGWNINVGAINRQMRGLPDDFSGDLVTNNYQLRENVTVGVGFDVNKVYAEMLGIPKDHPAFTQTGFNTQIYYNTYKGLGYRLSYSGLELKRSLGSVGANIHFDSQSGIGVEPNFSIGDSWGKVGMSLSGNLSLNSREGIQSFGFALSPTVVSNSALYKNTNGYADDGGFSVGGTSALSFSTSQGVTTSSLPLTNVQTGFDLDIIGEAGKYYTNTQFVDGTWLISHSTPGAFASKDMSFWSGYVNYSNVVPSTTEEAYGYLYDHQSNNSASSTCLRDFSRDPFQYSNKLPNLPSSNATYDIYMMSGQGVGGFFRPYQQSIRRYSTQSRDNETKYYRLNAEVGLDDNAGSGTFDEYHVGLGFSWGTGGTYSGNWTDIGNTPDVLFASDLDDFETAQEPLNEFAPFKMYGEKTAILLSSEDQLDEWDNDNAVRVELQTETGDGGWLNAHFAATTEVSDGTASYTPFDFTASEALLNKDQRERRATDIEYYSAGHAQLFGTTKNIGYSWTFNQGTELYEWDNVAKTYPSHVQSHHLSEISVLKPDGMRYIYGLPAYNRSQRDAYFSVQVAGSTFNTQEVPIPDDGTDIDPSGTPDNFLSETELPPYVHSWLLTTVVSADYLDLTGDGPTDDDYGYWVRFNYKQTSDEYAWRVPYTDGSFIVGNASDINDDKATMSYGQKEIYYIESIETKTHIAVFTTSAREDALAAKDRLNGGKPNSPTSEQKMYKLDAVSLYTKAEFFSDISIREVNPSAVAIQTAHFRYSYDLCPSVPNNTGNDVDVYGGSVSQNDPDNINSVNGKLTLDTLFFTYETSSRGEFSPYVFHYDNSNPQYERKNMDRWGNYKNNGNYTTYPYVDFPYTEQDATPDAGVWSMSSIDLPTGATMQITYEPDDYQYVENRKALRMFDIVGTGENGANDSYVTTRSGTAQTASLETNAEVNNGKYKLYFKLESHYTSGTGASLTDFYDRYLDNGALDTVYFKVYADIKGIFGSYFDYVSGYARVSYGSGEYGLEESTSGSGVFNIGFITLLGEDLQRFQNAGPKVHPFTRAGIEHVHYNRPDIATTIVPQSPNPLNQAINFISSIPGVANDAISMIAGYNQWAYMKGFSKKIKLNGWSVIRLQDPDEKFGGGDRVAELKLVDTWENDGTSNNRDNFSYGQKYSYDLEDGTSSGVAYEPQIGGDENALRTPRPYEHSVPVKGTQHLFIENPIMESYYPGAGVGYSRVTVESIGPDNALAESVSSDNLLLHTSAPISVYEFYTPKDFPVLVDETPITADASIVRPIMIPGIYSDYKKQMARSQGYSVVLNDMAGKLRSVEIRTRPTVSGSSNNADGSLISRQTFIYNTEEPYSEDKVNKLCSKVQVMSCSSGVVKYQTALVGQSHDIFIDMNENREYMKSRGVDVNLELQFVVATGTLSFLWPMPLVNISKSDVRQRTVVVNKIIHRSGILKEVVTTDHESTVKSTFIAFDKETGEPLLTKITNEYEDDVYGFTYPAHWYYPAMQGAYKNFGVEISSVTSPGTFPITVSTGGRINLQGNLPTARTANDYFTVGDKIWVDVTTGTDAIYTVIKVGVSGSNEYIDCIDESGSFISSSLTVNAIRVIRSGYLNLQTLAAGSLTSKTFGVTPYDEYSSTGLQTNPASVTIDETIDVLNASAVEYTDVWQTPCKDCEGVTNPNATVNPYRWGIRGKWRPLKSFAYYVGRTQTNNIVEDGVYTDFSEFNWINPSASDAKWTSATTVTKYSPHGYELENKDAIGNYSAALYEFGESVVTAIASNARYKEIASDGFEDYAYINTCNQQFDHWGFGPSDADISTTEHHTGRYSLKVTQATGSEAISRDLVNDDCESFQQSRKLVIPPTDGTASTQYTMDQCDCIGEFSPIVGEKYVISTWVKETGASTPPEYYTNAEIKVELLNSGGTPISGGTFTFAPQAGDPMIEGWQRVYGEFEVLSGTAKIRVTYVNTTATGEVCYFDDTRIHPFDANMVTYVYDPVSFKRVAELDANNYATFYIYDEEGQLTAVKKETTAGIKTLREGRSVIVPNNQ